MPEKASPGTTVRSALDLSYADLAGIFNRCFEGYNTPVSVGAATLEARFRTEAPDLAASRVYFDGEQAVGLVVITRRGWTCRIGALGVAPEKRGGGLGTRIMEDAIAASRSRGEKAMLLEVIEQNVPAVNLYRKLGFDTLRRLVGYRLMHPEGGEGDIEEMDVLDFARVAASEGEDDLPWMLAPETFSAYGAPHRAYRLANRAFALIGDPDAETMGLSAVVVPRRFRRQGWGERLMRALFARHRGREWAVIQIVPEGLAPGFFEGLGFERDELTQFEMRLTL